VDIPLYDFWSRSPAQSEGGDVIASRCGSNTKAMGFPRFWALARAASEYPGEMRLVQETGGANAIGASESSVDNISPAPMKV
jgi:hypothetical protein